MHSMFRARRRSARFALAAAVAAVAALAALAGGTASSAATTTRTGTAVFSSLDRFRAEGPVPGPTVSRTSTRQSASPSLAWESAGTLANVRSRLGLAFFPPNGHFYAIGGETTAGNRAIPIEEYNPAGNSWTNRAMLLTGVSNTGAATVGNFIYVPGGYDGVAGISTMQRYEPLTNTVVNVAPMPAGNFAHAVAAQGTKVYVLGGSATGFAGTTNMIYDTATNTWTTGAPAPTAVQYAAAVSDGTYVYLLGGYTPDMNIVQRYNPATNSWDTRSTMLAARGGAAAFFDGSSVWAVGGGWTTYLTGTESYNAATNAWTVGPAMTAGVRTLGAAFGNSLVLKAGGWNGNYVGTAERMAFPPPPPPPPVRCRVPRVIGLRLAAAKTRIRRANCAVGRVRRSHSKRSLRGRVIGQTPKPRAVKPRGFRVNLVVGRR